MKLAAVVILYHPDIEALKKNIESYCGVYDKLILWNNGAQGIENLGFEVMDSGENMLIAKPLNVVLRWCKENGYTHLLTMDQDSRFADNKILEFKEIIPKLKDGAIFGVNPNKAYDKFTEPSLFPDVITSGTVYDVAKILEIGGFREDFGIDAVDIEVCYRAKQNGYNTYVIPDIRLIQQYGSPKKTKMGFTTINYSAFRCYHITRNFVIMWRQYPKLFKQHEFFVKIFLLKGIPKIILGEKHKIKKLRAIFFGFYDGLRGKTPKRNF